MSAATLVFVADAVIAVAWVRMLIGVARRPASRWPTRWWGKSFHLAVMVLCFGFGAGLVLPLGAVWVWWRTVVKGRDPFELPMADGRPQP